jgi:hypothetical protein
VARNEDQGVHLGQYIDGKSSKALFICLDNAGYEVSLERLKIYVALSDAKANRSARLHGGVVQTELATPSIDI